MTSADLHAAHCGPAHHSTLYRVTWTRGVWASCCCGWNGQRRWTTVVGAHLEFGRHLIGKETRDGA